MFRFNKIYFLIACLLFLTEILIAVYTHDELIRPYGGDFLVVILLYCLIKSFLTTDVKITGLAVLLFAYVLETLQHFNLVNKLGLEDYAIARIVIGTSFAWGDLVAYTLGISLVFAIEKTYRSGRYKEGVSI